MAGKKSGGSDRPGKQGGLIMNPTMAKYHESLDLFPAPGCGQGCHPWQMKVANLGVRAGL